MTLMTCALGHGRGLHFVATGVHVRDDTTTFPRSLARVLQDLRARALASAEEHAVGLTRGEPGSWREQTTPGLSVWRGWARDSGLVPGARGNHGEPRLREEGEP